jgi:hypothetical protein
MCLEEFSIGSINLKRISWFFILNFHGKTTMITALFIV